MLQERLTAQFKAAAPQGYPDNNTEQIRLGGRFLLGQDLHLASELETNQCPGALGRGARR